MTCFVLTLSNPDIHFPCSFLQVLPGGSAGICRPAETFNDASASWINSCMQLWLVSFKVKFQFTQVSQTLDKLFIMWERQCFAFKTFLMY